MTMKNVTRMSCAFPPILRFRKEIIGDITHRYSVLTVLNLIFFKPGTQILYNFCSTGYLCLNSFKCKSLSVCSDERFSVTARLFNEFVNLISEVSSIWGKKQQTTFNRQKEALQDCQILQSPDVCLHEKITSELIYFHLAQ